MALLHYLRSNREIVLAQTIQQVVSNAGDGSLRDGNQSSTEFREFLTLVPIDSLFAYVPQCLDAPFQKSGPCFRTWSTSLAAGSTSRSKTVCTKEGETRLASTASGVSRGSR